MKPRTPDAFRNKEPLEPKRNSKVRRGARNAHTPAPRAKTLQLTIAWMVSLKSRLNSIVNRMIAEPMPPMTQVPTKVKTIIVENARVFFHAGQLRGSLTSSEGWGIRTMSFLDFKRWAASQYISKQKRRRGEIIYNRLKWLSLRTRRILLRIENEFQTL